MSALWDLLPANVVKYAKGILAIAGAVLTIVFTTVPGLSGARWAVVAVAVLAALGVVVVPNQNAKTERPQGLRRADGTPYVYKEKRRYES